MCKSCERGYKSETKHHYKECKEGYDYFVIKGNKLNCYNKNVIFKILIIEKLKILMNTLKLDVIQYINMNIKEKNVFQNVVKILL